MLAMLYNALEVMTAPTSPREAGQEILHAALLISCAFVGWCASSALLSALGWQPLPEESSKGKEGSAVFRQEVFTYVQANSIKCACKHFGLSKAEIKTCIDAVDSMKQNNQEQNIELSPLIKPSKPPAMPGSKKKAQPKKKRNQDTAKNEAVVAEEASHSGPESADLEAAEELTVEFKAASSRHPGLALLEHYGVFGVQSGTWSGPYMPEPASPMSYPPATVYEDDIPEESEVEVDIQDESDTELVDEPLNEHQLDDSTTASEDAPENQAGHAGLDIPPSAKRMRVEGCFSPLETQEETQESPQVVEEDTAAIMEPSQPCAGMHKEPEKPVSPSDAKKAALNRDYMKISKKLREIAALESRVADGIEIEKLQMEKLQKKGTLEHELRTIKIAIAMLSKSALKASEPQDSIIKHDESRVIDQQEPQEIKQEFYDDGSSWVSPEMQAMGEFYNEEPMQMGHFEIYQAEAVPQFDGPQEPKIGYHPSLGVVFDSNLLEQINEAEREAGEDGFSPQTYTGAHGTYNCDSYGPMAPQYTYDFQARAWVLKPPAAYTW